MHIAICDDNVADRKQLERLLERESDKRASSTGILYTDSFGNVSALLAAPLQYNLFYIDICKTDGITGYDVANSLLQRKGSFLVVMCCSDINYRKQVFPENVIFLDKPIKTQELASSIDRALTIMQNAIPFIELREDNDTVYVTESDILHVVEMGNHYTTVTLIDGRKIQARTTVCNLFAELQSYPSFLSPSSKVILNGRYIDKLKFHKATMTDGTSFKIHPDCITYAKQLYNEYHNIEPNQKKLHSLLNPF